MAVRFGKQMCLLEIQQAQWIPRGKRRIQSFSSIENNAGGSKVVHIPHCEAFCLHIVLIFVLFCFVFVRQADIKLTT